MFSSGPNYDRLKTNLRLCINRMKLLEKKKTELALKSRKEIADYIAMGKSERAKIRVEHIVREDYLVEALELLEMFCDLLLARFGLIKQMKTLDDGLAEAISSIIWAAPRLQTDIQELRVVADQLTAKYGKLYADACLQNNIGSVSEKLMHKMSIQAPPKLTVEKYLVEIAKYYNVDYHPDPQILQLHEGAHSLDPLVDLDIPAPPLQKKDQSIFNGDLGGGGAAATSSARQPSVNPSFHEDFLCPYPQNPANGVPHGGGPYEYPPPPLPHPPPPPSYFSQNNDTNIAGVAVAPVPQELPDVPDLPAVPDALPSGRLGESSSSSSSDDDNVGNAKKSEEQEIDFDDLTKRFEELKKKK